MQAKALFLSLLLPFFVYCHDTMLIIDTSNNDPHIYRNFSLLAQSVGYQPIVKPFYEVSPNSLSSYQTILLSLDGSLLVAMAKELSAHQQTVNPLLKHFLSLIETLGKRTNSSIGIIVPMPNKKSISIFSLIKQILAKIGVDTNDKQIVPFIDNSLNHLMHSDASKSFGYDTALLYKRMPNDESNNSSINPTAISSLTLSPLPQAGTFSHALELKPLFPLGVAIKNQRTGNTVFITNQSYMHVADINEPFMLNPVNTNLRHSLLTAQHAMLKELKQMQTGQNIQSTFPPLLTEQYPIEKKKQFGEQRKQLADNYQWINQEGIACGWMHLDPFSNKE